MNSANLESAIARTGIHFATAAAPQVSSAITSAASGAVTTMTGAASAVVSTAVAIAPVALPLAGIGILCWGAWKLLDD